MSSKIRKDLGKLIALKTSVPQNADRIVEKSALRIETGAKLRAPVGETGNLRAGITVEKTGNAARKIGSNVDYEVFVELGTYTQKAQPHLYPAADEETPRLERELRGVVK